MSATKPKTKPAEDSAPAAPETPKKAPASVEKAARLSATPVKDVPKGNGIGDAVKSALSKKGPLNPEGLDLSKLTLGAVAEEALSLGAEGFKEALHAAGYNGHDDKHIFNTLERNAAIEELGELFEQVEALTLELDDTRAERARMVAWVQRADAETARVLKENAAQYDRAVQHIGALELARVKQDDEIRELRKQLKQAAHAPAPEKRVVYVPIPYAVPTTDPDGDIIMNGMGKKLDRLQASADAIRAAQNRTWWKTMKGVLLRQSAPA